MLEPAADARRPDEARPTLRDPALPAAGTHREAGLHVHLKAAVIGTLHHRHLFDFGEDGLLIVAGRTGMVARIGAHRHLH
jgi:hypothetical protein